MAESDGIHHSEHWASQFVDHTGTLLEEELRKVAGHLEHPVPAQPLPPPAVNERSRTFRMSLADVVEPNGDETAHSRLLLRLRFGDRFPPPQRVVAYHLAQDAHRAPRTAPVACLFHLGDVVCHYGETSGYPDQFHAPYGVYPEPIFAIPGNHDAMVEFRLPAAG